MADPARARLLQLYRSRAFSFGSFTLASGKQSTYYVNSKKILFQGEALALIGQLLYAQLKDLDVHGIGGPEVGAIPIAAAVSLHAYRDGKAWEGFFVRKQPKGHGSQEMVEGVLGVGDRVAVVEDVVTTGESVLRAIREVEKVGAQVVAVTCLVDRLEGAAKVLTPAYDFRPLFTIRDFGVQPGETA